LSPQKSPGPFSDKTQPEIPTEWRQGSSTVYLRHLQRMMIHRHLRQYLPQLLIFPRQKSGSLRTQTIGGAFLISLMAFPKDQDNRKAC
jgi:hypothetical protein